MIQPFKDFILIGKIILKDKFEFCLPNMQNQISFLEPKSGFPFFD